MATCEHKYGAAYADSTQSSGYAKRCGLCGEIVEANEGEACEHIWVIEENSGYSSGYGYQCAMCGEWGDEAEEPKEEVCNHTFEATYDDRFSSGYGEVCTQCGAMGEELDPSSGGDDTHEHDWQPGTAVPPTCTTQGYTNYTCSCGETMKGDYVDAEGHVFVETESDQFSSGRGYVCSKCGALGDEISDSGDTDDEPIDGGKNDGGTKAVGDEWQYISSFAVSKISITELSEHLEQFEREDGSVWLRAVSEGIAYVTVLINHTPPEIATTLYTIVAKGAADDDTGDDDPDDDNTGEIVADGATTKVTFPVGVTSVKLDPVYQWDYGRKLEIDATDMSTIVELHFAHSGMTEAIAYACSVKDGVITVPIPNECLEQTSDIRAWVYEYEGDTGRTTREITIPVTPRIRPPRNPDVPKDISNRYTEVITQVNAMMDGLKDGSTIVKYAETAKLADEATTVKNAANATSADFATTSGSAYRDGNRTVIHTWYIKNTMEYDICVSDEPIDGGLIEFRIALDIGNLPSSVIVNVQGNGVSPLFSIGNYITRLKFNAVSGGKYLVEHECLDDTEGWCLFDHEPCTIMYQHLSDVSNAGDRIGSSGGYITVGTTFVRAVDVNTYTLIASGSLSVYQDSTQWEVTAERAGVGTVLTVEKSSGEIVDVTTYTVVE